MSVLDLRLIKHGCHPGSLAIVIRIPQKGSLLEIRDFVQRSRCALETIHRDEVELKEDVNLSSGISGSLKDLDRAVGELGGPRRERSAERWMSR